MPAQRLGRDQAPAGRGRERRLVREHNVQGFLALLDELEDLPVRGPAQAELTDPVSCVEADPDQGLRCPRPTGDDQLARPVSTVGQSLEVLRQLGLQAPGQALKVVNDGDPMVATAADQVVDRRDVSLDPSRKALRRGRQPRLVRKSVLEERRLAGSGRAFQDDVQARLAQRRPESREPLRWRKGNLRHSRGLEYLSDLPQAAAGRGDHGGIGQHAATLAVREPALIIHLSSTLAFNPAVREHGSRPADCRLRARYDPCALRLDKPRL